MYFEFCLVCSVLLLVLHRHVHAAKQTVWMVEDNKRSNYDKLTIYCLVETSDTVAKEIKWLCFIYGLNKVGMMTSCLLFLLKLLGVSGNDRGVLSEHGCRLSVFGSSPVCIWRRAGEWSASP